MKQLLRKVTSSKLARLLALLVFFAATFSGIAAVGMAAASQATPRVAGGECDDNAIIRCGVSQNGIGSAVAGLDAKGKGAYTHAGIPGSCSFGNTVVGVTTSDNKVVVGGQVVATNVKTYGREEMPGSVQVPGGAWQRSPSVSFRGAAITSYVCMDGKEFKWAVISTCGNPVTGTPTFKNNPRLSIEKTSNKTVVNPNDTFNYSITVKNIGNVAVKNVVVADVLPKGIVPVDLNPGVTYNPANRKITFPTLPNMPVGTQFTKTFKVKVNPNIAPGRYINIACVTSSANPNLPLCDDVPVDVKKPKITIKKDVSVTSPVDINQEFDYVIKVTNTGNVRITNARITDTLPDGVVAVDTPNSRTVEFNIASLAPGASRTFTFKAKVVVSAPAGTKFKNVACIDETDQTDELICDDADVEVKTPKYSCDAVNTTKLSNTQYRFNASTTAQNGAVLKSVSWNFGDGSTAVTGNPVTHTYAQPGTYDITATATFTVNGQDVVAESTNCKARVTVEPPQPVFACTALNVSTVDADQKLPFNVTFDATATASNGAVIQSYLWNFGDGQSTETTGNSVAHSYTAAGNFTATVQVKTNAGTTPVSAACSKTIEVEEDEEEVPVYTCDVLTITKVSDLKYSFKVDYTAENGAVLKNIALDFGDGTPVVNGLTNPVEHTYAEAGEYNTMATLTFTVNGEEKVVTSNACKATTDKPPVTPMCPYPGKEHLPKDSPLCVEDVPEEPETPEEVPAFIPDTGPGEVLGMIAATTAAGMIAYRMVWARRYL